MRLLQFGCLMCVSLVIAIVGTAWSGQEDRESSQGVIIDSFRLLPKLVVTEVFDDNIFFTRNDRVQDFITVFSPSLAVESDWAKHEFNLRSGLDIGRYEANDSENYIDYWASTDGRYDLTPNWNLFGGSEFYRDHEGRESPDDDVGTAPTTFKDIRSHLGTAARIDRLSLRFGGTFQRLDYRDVPRTLGEINQDDRDRSLFAMGSRLGYELAPGYKAFVQGTYDVRRYKSSLDDFGFDRDSDGYQVAGGLGIEAGDNLKAEILAGYMAQSYGDPALDSVGAVDLGVRLTWRPTPFTILTGFVDRSIAETTLPGASSYLNTALGVTVTHELTNNLIFTGRGTYANNDYRGIGRQDNLFSAGLGLRYLLSKNVFAEGEYSFRHRDSSDSTENYISNAVLLRLGAQLASIKTRRASLPAAPASDGVSAASFSGAYLGAQTGVGRVDSTLEGPRGNNGALKSDFSGFGGVWGGFAGYGFAFDQWYLGMEGEGDTGTVEWDHARLPGGRVFMVGRRASFGVAARLGYALAGGSLLYGRLGMARTTFDTHYEFGSTIIDQEDTLTGLRVGAGLEVPLSDHLFLRFDYTHTNYGDYAVNFGPGVDSFDNADNQVRLGIGYRFNYAAENQLEQQANTAHSFAGLYAGAHGGAGGFSTEVQGPRTGGSQLNADFGDSGLSWGGFAGYGMALGKAYLGVEGEVETSSAGHEHIRAPTGRTFAVEKNVGYGANLRLGYVLDDRALFYGRAGLVRTKFATRYSTGAVSLDQDDTQTGYRFGGGIEVPVTSSIFLRLDFTHTTYGRYMVDYGSGVDRFDPSESQFRLGVGFRF